MGAPSSPAALQGVGRRRCRRIRGRRSGPTGAGDGSPDPASPEVFLPLGAALLPRGRHHGEQKQPEEHLASATGGKVTARFLSGLSINGVICGLHRKLQRVLLLLLLFFVGSVLLCRDGAPSNPSGAFCSEKSGSCVGNMVISGPVRAQAEGAFLHRFRRSRPVPQSGFHRCGLASGDRVVVGDQEGRFVGLATGYLCEVNEASVSCSLDR